MSLLIDHWRRLDAAVHPDDTAAFGAQPHNFNLNYPPPAYLGDVENAPFVVLMMNGGYDPVITPKEFPDDLAVARYIDLLHHPRPVDPLSISPYYDAGNYRRHIASGKLALINAVAYRSGKLSTEPQNKKLAERLPSTALHRRWLREELIPQALGGERVIIAHRNGMWALSRAEIDHPNVIFTGAGVSPHLPRGVLALLE